LATRFVVPSYLISLCKMQYLVSLVAWLFDSVLTASLCLFIPSTDGCSIFFGVLATTGTTFFSAFPTLITWLLLTPSITLRVEAQQPLHSAHRFRSPPGCSGDHGFRMRGRHSSGSIAITTWLSPKPTAFSERFQVPIALSCLRMSKEDSVVL
jgi:hypothetical protein